MWKKTMIGLFGHEDVSAELESISYTLMGIGIAGLVLGFVMMVTGAPGPFLLIPFAAVAMGAYGAYMFEVGYANPIPNTPPSVALLSIWGQRLPVILKEGETFLPDVYPLRISRKVFYIQKENRDFTFSGIRCRLDPIETAGQSADHKVDQPHSGGAITVKGSWTFGPDTSTGERLLAYDNAGEEQGVVDQSEDIFGAAIRAVATERTWEEVTFLESALAAVIAVRVTDARILKLKRVEGSPHELVHMNEWPKNDPVHGINEYRDLADAANDSEIIEDPVAYLDDPDITTAERKARQREIDWFLKQAIIDGVADVHGLGAVITRISIVDIDPEGQLKKDAEDAAREILQRRTQTYDTETGLRLAKKFIDEATANGEKLSLAEAMRFTQVDRKLAQQVYVNSSSGNPLLEAAAVATRNK